MTLRARLIALLMAVTTLALAIVVSVGVLTLRAYLTDRLDGQLEIIAEFVRARQDEILANDPEALIGDVSAPRELLVEIESDAVVHRDPTFDSSLLDAVTGGWTRALRGPSGTRAPPTGSCTWSCPATRRAWWWPCPWSRWRRPSGAWC